MLADAARSVDDYDVINTSPAPTEQALKVVAKPAPGPRHIGVAAADADAAMPAPSKEAAVQTTNIVTPLGEVSNGAGRLRMAARCASTSTSRA